MIIHLRTLLQTMVHLWTRFKKWSILISSYLSSGRHDRAVPRYTSDSHREEDVSTTMYRETLQVVPVENRITEPETSKGGNLSKINKICDAFLEVLQSRGPAHIQNVITAHVCKSPPDLDAGLIEISKIRRKSSMWCSAHGCFSPWRVRSL